MARFDLNVAEQRGTMFNHTNKSREGPAGRIADPRNGNDEIRTTQQVYRQSALWRRLNVLAVVAPLDTRSLSNLRVLYIHPDSMSHFARTYHIFFDR